jgi:HK97 family phage major capsid protein
MPFNNIIQRSDVQALIPEDVSDVLLENVAKRSIVMQLARRLRNMTTAQTRMPVIDALATAYFVSPRDTGLKQTTEISWANKYVDAEEIAAIVPIPEAVLDDTSYDVWGQVRPAIEEAMAVLIDQAVLYGTSIPATWTTNIGAAGIVAGALGAGHQISLAAYTDLYEAILGENPAGASGLFGFIEDDGFMVNGSIAHLSMKRKLRNVRDTEGGLIFSNSMQQAGAYTLDGAPCIFPDNGAISAVYYLISGAWSQLVYAMRQDVTYKVLDQAVITDGAGQIIYNLPQQDMVALRAVMRLGFALPNPINRINPVAATRYPFATLTA